MNGHPHQSPHRAATGARLPALIVFTAAALGMPACSNNDNPINPPIGQLRVANAIADSNPVDATVVSIPYGIDNIAFGNASGLKDVPDGSYRIQLTTSTNAGQLTFSADSTHIDKNHATTVYAVGRISQGSQAAFVVEAAEPEITSDKSEVQFVNVASQQISPLDIYVTAPGASLLGVLPTTTLALPSSNQPALYPPGPYEIRVTQQGNPATVLFDSGPVGVQFPPATAQQFALLDNTNNAIPSPLFLLILTGAGGNYRVQHGGS